MADYIEREAAIENIVKHSYPVRYDYASIENGMTVTGIRQALDELPAADVTPVVRCEECKYCRKEDEFEYWCYGFCSPARLVRKDDFCSHGCKTE